MQYWKKKLKLTQKNKSLITFNSQNNNIKYYETIFYFSVYRYKCIQSNISKHYVVICTDKKKLYTIHILL